MDANLTRRSFVAGSAATAAAIAATGAATALADAANEADVIVVGAGASGLAAAAGAGEAGASVVVLEAADHVGGACLISGGHLAMLDPEFNAKQPRNDADLNKFKSPREHKYYDFAADLTTLKKQIAEYQADQSIVGKFDSLECMLVDQYYTGVDGYGRLPDLDGVPNSISYPLCRAMLEHNMDVNAWLMETGGMQIEDKPYKMHANTPVGKGAGLVEALSNCAAAAGAEILLGVRATELVVEDGKIAGVRAADGTEYRARRGVVLATGSFSSNGEMCAKYQRVGEALDERTPSDNVRTNVGDGHLMAESVGAKFRDMSFINTILLGYENGNTATEMPVIDGKQQFAVNCAAMRFCDDQSSATITAPAGNQPGGVCYYVGDRKMRDAMEEKSEGCVEDYVSRGWLFVGDTLEEAAEAAGLDSRALAHTVSLFNRYVETGIDIDFKRSKFNGKVEEGPFVIAKMQIHYHLTLGGVVIDTEARVLNEDGGTIPGLYAAGDIMWGIEGYTHQSGANLTGDIYYGKVAGTNAMIMGSDDEYQVVVEHVEPEPLEPSIPVELSEEQLAVVGELIQIPAGSFIMGSPDYEMYRDANEGPQTEISLRSFAVAKHPVSLGQYKAFVEETGRPDPEKAAEVHLGKGFGWYSIPGVTSWRNPFHTVYNQTDDDPVTCVSWQDAKDFIAWASEKTGLPLRLLSEAEYEYAMRAGTTTPFYTGDTITYKDAQFGRHYRWATVPNGTLPPNQWGLCSMAGNVWCWCEDDYADQDLTDVPRDGSPWVIDGAEKKVIRGGSWNIQGEYLRSANRDGYAPDVLYSRVGFRIAMDVE